VYWPLLLIGAGILILTKRLIYPNSGFEAWGEKWQHHGNRMQEKYQRKNWKKNADGSWEKSSGGFSKNSVFGSGEHIVLDTEFTGGELNAVFGGLTIDLRRTNLPEGETVLDVNAVFGGITIFVPYEWLVETHIDAVFGGFQDNRMPKEPLDTTRKLIITGACVFGGGELRN
jgi:predicted membrane protein